MKKIVFPFSIVVLMFLISCNKEQSNNFEINTKDQLYTFDFDTNSIINLSDTLSEGEVIWYEFNAVAGEVYDLSWFDRVFTFSELSYTVDESYASIFVSVYHENKTNAILTNEKISDLKTSTHKTIIASKTETIYIKITATNRGMNGKFMLYVNHLDVLPQTAKKVESQQNFTIDSCKTKIFCINSREYATYGLFWNQLTPSGSYGGNVIEIRSSAYFNSIEYCFFEKSLSYNKSISLLSPETGKIFIVFNAPYKGESATFEIEQL